MVTITLEVSEEFINKIADASVDEFLALMGKMNPISMALYKIAFLKLQENVRENRESMVFINSDTLDNDKAKLFISNVAECYMLSEVMNKEANKSED